MLLPESSCKINVKTCVFLINLVSVTKLLTSLIRTLVTSARFASLNNYTVEVEVQAFWEMISVCFCAKKYETGFFV